MENQVSTGLSQFTAGANGLITMGNCIGAPATVALAVGVYVPGCVLFQRDSSTGYTTVPWQNTGTAAAPSWTSLSARKVISGSAATVSLTSAQSGATVLMDKADGIVFTLPAPVVGLEFTFLVLTTITSNSYKVITSGASIFMAGSILGSIDNTANKSWVGNGSTHVAVTQAAASTNATGGIIGSMIKVTCISALQWNVTGMTVAGGTPTTPFATS